MAVAFVIGVAVALLTPVTPVFATPTVAPLFTAPLIELAVTPPAGATIASAAPSPPAPLVMTGVGAELIDEFTVDCGFAVNDGHVGSDVACCMLRDGCVLSPGAAGPRTRPRYASSALSVARASVDDGEGEAETIPCGGTPVVPEDEPGVDAGLVPIEPAAGALLAGCPLTVELLSVVLQPKAASEMARVATARMRPSFRSLSS